MQNDPARAAAEEIVRQYSLHGTNADWIAEIIRLHYGHVDPPEVDINTVYGFGFSNGWAAREAAWGVKP